MLGKFSSFRHLLVGTVVAGTGVLGATGVIGGGSHPEIVDHWQAVISPADGEGLRIREVFDQDFGSHDRHGPERWIPNDFGLVSDVTAYSADAPDDLQVDVTGDRTRLRIGDPDTEVSGQHRYQIEYTLPEARLGTGILAVDAMGNDYEFEMREAEVIINGFVLGEPRCFVGRFGSTTPCDIVQTGERQYRAVVAPLTAGFGITIDGTIEVAGGADAVPLPDLPERRSSPNRGLVGLGLAGLGVAASLPVYGWARRKGRNEVFAGGAVEAAFGELPAPSVAPAGGLPAPGAATPRPQQATVLVPDSQLAELATIEFVPPAGVDPWEGAVLLTERIDNDTAAAYLSGLVGKELIEVEQEGKNLSITAGPKRHLAATEEARVIDSILRIDDPYVTGTYDAKFAGVWASISAYQKRRIATLNWWKNVPTGGASFGGSAGFVVAFTIVIFALTSGVLSAVLGAVKAWPMAIAFAVVVPMLVAFAVYRVMLPSRTAQGSALALRTESFRRFLHASEGQHVEWAWERGVLREYSAWAVALGEADAWSKALDSANVPEPARAMTTPMFVYAAMPSIQSTNTAPSSSGSSGGGGFSGGSVGGGGGGGGGGSW